MTHHNTPLEQRIKILRAMLESDKDYLTVLDFMPLIIRSRTTTYRRLTELGDLVERKWFWDWNIPRFSVPSWLLPVASEWVARVPELIASFEEDQRFGPFSCIVVDDLRNSVVHRTDDFSEAVLMKLGSSERLRIYEKEAPTSSKSESPTQATSNENAVTAEQDS